MLKKLLFAYLFIFTVQQSALGQPVPVTVSNLILTGKLLSTGAPGCPVGTSAPIITVNWIGPAGDPGNGFPNGSGPGSSAAGGTITCLDPCDTTIVHIVMSNIRWNQGPDVNWIHGVFFPAAAGFTFLNTNLSPLNWSFVQAGCTGINGINGPNFCGNTATGGNAGTVGGPGWYFHGPFPGCCPGGGTTPSPCDNWGDGSFTCNVPMTFGFYARICNNVLTSTGFTLTVAITADGNTGCWSMADVNTNILRFTLATSPCGTLYSPAPTAPAPTLSCAPAISYSTTLTGGCGNGNTITWWTASTGGTQVGSGSPFVYTTATCSAGTTLYAACCPVGSTCINRKAFAIGGPCPSAVAISGTTVTQPTCANPTGGEVQVTAAGGSGTYTYTISPGGTSNSTGHFGPGLAPGPYTVTVNDGSCTASTSFTINSPTTGGPGPTATSPITYCQNATAVPLTATGTNLLWYTVAAGGVGSATAPTPSTVTAGSTTYYVSQNPTGSCESVRTPIVVNVTATPAAPTVTSPISYCQNDVAIPLTATGTNLLWYTVAAGGVGSATAPTPSTATIGSTTYYVSQTVGTCESPRAAIIVNVTAPPAAPTVTTPVTYCQGATAVALTATGINLLWYTTAVGGVGSATAPTPSTVTVGSTIYYVSQTSGTCESPRAAITVTINPTPAAPAVTSPVTYCQGAPTVPLTATGTNLLWYTTAVGGVGSATAPTPSSATVGSTIWYVSQTTGICEGPRAVIIVTINATPAAPTVTSPVTYCQNAAAVPLTATGTNLLWYTTAVGGVGSATAPTPSTAAAGSTTYYVSQTTGTCEGPRAAITVNITALPAAPTVASPVTYCQNAAAVPLTATGTNLLWYTTAVGGVGSATAPTPSTAAAGATIYYVSQTVSTCEGPRAAITVNITATPAAPAVTSPVDYCQGAAAVPLTATGTNLLWYTAAVGGVGSATAPTPSTAAGGSTTYYVSQTVSTCESPRAAITVNVTATPAAPTVTSPVTYCQNAAAVPLTATGTNLLWYTAAVGGVGSATAPTPSTAAAGSTTYYVSQTTGVCEGPRAAITVNITALPAAPTVTSPVTYCQNAAAVPLTATGTNLLWYTTAVGGVGSATAPTPSTAAAGSTIYYVSQTVSTCEGPRAAITVNITATPAAPAVTSPVDYCQNAAAVPLTATGTNLLWYTAAVGGVGSATAPTPSTAAGGSTTYYVSQTVSTCESPRAAITVNVTATPAAPTVTSPVTYCQNAVAVPLTATGTNLLWYTAAVGGVGSATAPTPSTAAAGSTIYYVSQTTATCEGPRAAITVNITALPAAPTVTSPVTYCQNAPTVALTATGTNLLWYTTAVGGVGSATAPTPSSATAGSTIYYVSQNASSCEGPRASITVTINPTPAAPAVTSPVAYCQGAAATALTATGTNLLWYTAAVGGVGSATAPTPSTAAGGSTIYYVSQTTGACEGPRAAITVNVTATPAAPTVTSPVIYCQGVTATPLTATGTSLLWYNSPVGGVGSATAPTPSTATTGNTDYYVSQSTGVCEGPRALITVTVNPTPGAPAVTSPVVYCQGTPTVALTATGTNLLWYTAAVGGVGSATAPTPSSATAGSTIYYVSQTTGVCEGLRAAITVTINPTPAAPGVTTPVPYCQNAASVPLTATGTNLLWYTAAVGGVGSATAPTPSTATLGSTTWYVSATTGVCEGPRAAITVNINPNSTISLTSLPATAAQTVCINTALVNIVYTTGGSTTNANVTGLPSGVTAIYSGGTNGTFTISGTPSVSGSFNYTVFAVGNCASASLNGTITVNPASTVTLSSAPATAAQTLCINTAIINITYTTANGVTGAVVSGLPIGITGTYSGGTNGTITISGTPTVSGSFNYTVTTSGGCGVATKSGNINVIPNSTLVMTSAAGTDHQVVCINKPITNITYLANNFSVVAVPGLPTGVTATYTAGGLITISGTPTVSGVFNYSVFVTGLAYNSVTCGTAILSGTITVNPDATISLTSSPATAAQTICVNTAINNIVYTPANGATGATVTGLPAGVTGTFAGGVLTLSGTATVSGGFNYTVTTSGGCNTASLSGSITVIATPPAPTVVSPVNYCPNATAVPLTATGTNLLWYTTATGGVGSPTAPTPSTSIPGTTNYYVSQTTTTGSCEGPRAVIAVVVNNSLTVNIGPDVTICQGDTLRLTPSVVPNADAFTWRSLTANVPNSSIDSLHTLNTTVHPVDTVQYELSATLGTCATKDTIQVNVRWKPIVDAGPNVAICLLDSVLLSATVTHTSNATATNITYAWTPTDSLTTPTALQTYVHPTHSTWYKLTATTTAADYGCDFIVSDSVKVVVQPVIHAFAGNDTIAMSGVPHQLHGQGGNYYFWSSPTPGVTLNNPNSQNATAILTGDANFFLRVEDAVGCKGYDSVFVKLLNGPTFYIPSAFTPNGDGLNDVLRPVPSGISTTIYFRVFNRYGELMFETTQYLKGWDGTYGGKPQPSGTYVWEAKGVDRFNKTVFLKGTVLLVR